MLGRVRAVLSAGCGLRPRLAASYVLVTLAVVVAVEAIVLGYQVPQLTNATRLQGPVVATAAGYAEQLTSQYAGGAVPLGAELGQPGRDVTPGRAQLAPDGGVLVVPAVSGPIEGAEAITAVVVIAPDGTIVASSAPSRYPPGQAAATLLPGAAAARIAQGVPKSLGDGDTPFGRVSWALAGLTGSRGSSGAEPRPVANVYVQTPTPSGFINPVAAWKQLRGLSDSGPLLTASYILLVAIVPAGALFGLLASGRLVRRIRRLERATVALAAGDYTTPLRISGRDEIGRLEENFAAMTGQLSSALTAERERATWHARAAERTRIAREIHDTISQHLFSIRMVAGGMLRAGGGPRYQEVLAIERITGEAIGDMQTLLQELRPASLVRAGLVPALEELCDAYRSRLGVEVDARLQDVEAPEDVEHALLRITQEAFMNAVRHGHARRIDVAAAREDGHIELSVRDTGTGFDPSTPHEGSGLGHIRDRVTELGGTIAIDSAPGHGAALTVRIPVP